MTAPRTSLYGTGRDRTVTPATKLGTVDNTRLGRCYELTATFALANLAEPWAVVHGTITGKIPGTDFLLPTISHAFAWLEDEGLVYEPATNTVYEEGAFRTLHRATFDHVFPTDGETGWRTVCVRYGHYGPWDGTCPPTGNSWDEDSDDDDDESWDDDDDA